MGTGAPMGGDALDPFIGIPKTLTPKGHPNFQREYLLTYTALKSFTSLEPANENYSRCFPSIPAICAVYNQGRRTVFRCLQWLEQNDYLCREREHCQRGSTLYTLILRREWFQQIHRKEGREEAIRQYEAWIVERQAAARGEGASEARRRGDKRWKHAPIKGDGLEVSARSPQGGGNGLEVSARSPQGCPDGHSGPGITLIKIQEKGVTTPGELHSASNPAEVLASPEIIAEKTKDGEDTIEERQRFIREQLAELVNTKAMPS